MLILHDVGNCAELHVTYPIKDVIYFFKDLGLHIRVSGQTITSK